MLSLFEKRDRQGIPSRCMLEATTGLYFLQRMKLDRQLFVHNGCVNTICWNEKGTLILSGSDDQHLAVTDPFTGKNLTKFRSGHRSNIFSAKFMPFSFDREVISCSGSGEIFYTNIEREDTYGTHRFGCHFGSTYKLLVVPNEASTFLSCGDDGTVRFFDLRVKKSCSKYNCEEDVVILLRNPVTSMAVDPVIPYQLAVSTSDGNVRLYDRRMMKAQDAHAMNESLVFKFAPPMAAISQGGSNGRQQRSYRVTSLNFRPGSHDLLVNYSSENIYLFNTYDIQKQMIYSTSLASTQQNPAIEITGASDAAPASTSRGIPQGQSASRDATASSSSTPPSDTGSDSDSSPLKPIKRLRLRGDWSDTGPDARPEGEESGQNIMQRMSDLLTRMLNSRGNESGAVEEDGDNENDDSREEPQQPSEDQAQAIAEQDEPNDLAANSRQEGSDEATAMLRSVLLRTVQSRATVRRAETEFTRSSISSEDMVSHDLSPPGVESTTMADSAMESNDQTSNLDDPASETLESNTQGLNSSGNAFPPAQTSSGLIEEDKRLEALNGRRNYADQEAGKGNILTSIQPLSDSENQVSIANPITHEGTESSTHLQSVTAQESESFSLGEPYSGQDTMVLDTSSSSSSDSTQTTVIDALRGKENEETSAISDTSCCKESSIKPVHHMVRHDETTKVTITERVLTAENNNPSSTETACDGNISVSERDGEASNSNEECSVLSEMDNDSQKIQITHAINDISKPNSQVEEELTSACKTDSPLKPKDSSDALSKISHPDTPGSVTSLLSSDSFTMASLWSSSPSATTNACAEDVQSNSECRGSEQTLCNIPSLSSLASQASITSDSELTSEKRLTDNSQRDCQLDMQRLPDMLDPDFRETLDEGTSGLADQEYSSPSQDYQVHLSSGPHHPCKRCKESRLLPGKGKGQGKSSSTQKSNDTVSSSDKFVSYNSGKMRVSDDAPPNHDEAGTSFGSKSSERSRRQGHSLPPTGKFQLYGSDDDDDNDEEDASASRKKLSSSIGSGQGNNERLSKAAKKIQEAFRQRREARESARIKEVTQPRVFMKFSGHRNCRTVIKEANFYGDNFVMSGSDCGRIMFWERETGHLVMYLDADKHVVNCVQPNPFFPVLASSGIDYDVKIWCPLEQDSQFDEVKSAEIIRCNERMLEVTRDTVTVPAAFMLRILASLSQARNGRGSERQQQGSDSGPASSNQE